MTEILNTANAAVQGLANGVVIYVGLAWIWDRAQRRANAQRERELYGRRLGGKAGQ